MMLCLISEFQTLPKECPRALYLSAALGIACGACSGGAGFADPRARRTNEFCYRFAMTRHMPRPEVGVVGSMSVPASDHANTSPNCVLGPRDGPPEHGFLRVLACSEAERCQTLANFGRS